MLYTSYYYYNHFPISSNIVSISYSVTPSARRAIDKFDWKMYTPLAPPWKLVDSYKKGLLTQSEYTEKYNKQLLTLDINKVLADLGKQAILLCYEPPTQFCHRHLVADWIRSYGIEIEELDIKHQQNRILTDAFEF